MQKSRTDLPCGKRTRPLSSCLSRFRDKVCGACPVAPGSGSENGAGGCGRGWPAAWDRRPLRPLKGPRPGHLQSQTQGHRRTPFLLLGRPISAHHLPLPTPQVTGTQLTAESYTRASQVGMGGSEALPGQELLLGCGHPCPAPVSLDPQIAGARPALQAALSQGCTDLRPRRPGGVLDSEGTPSTLGDMG